MVRSSAKRSAGSVAAALGDRPYGGVGAEQRRGARRERLIDAGLELFGTQGYARAPIERLCAHAGVATRHFYEQFDGREALLRAVYDRVIERTTLAVREALLDAPDDPRERSRRGIEAFLRAYLDDRRNGRVACIEVVGVSPELEAHRRDVMRAFAAIIDAEAERWARTAVLPVRDFRWTALALAGATNELVIEWLLGNPSPPISVLSAELVDLFVATLPSSRS